MAVAVGTDLVFVPRFQESLTRRGFATRAFTPRELDYCRSRPDMLAGRWAAKEATMKALGHGLGTIPLTDIEVCSEPSRVPRLFMHRRAAELAAEAHWAEVSVSISHAGDYAVATVVALMPDTPQDSCSCGSHLSAGGQLRTETVPRLRG